MEKIDLNVKKWMDELRRDCQIMHSREDETIGSFNEGWIQGVLAVLRKRTIDLCGECEGCDKPIAPYKNMREK